MSGLSQSTHTGRFNLIKRPKDEKPPDSEPAEPEDDRPTHEEDLLIDNILTRIAHQSFCFSHNAPRWRHLAHVFLMLTVLVSAILSVSSRKYIVFGARMPICAVLGCYSSSRTKQHLEFFRFPKEISVCMKWITTFWCLDKISIKYEYI